ncbi:MAG: TldD/PmbA family protein [Rhodospirillaceae bacterium]|nr:TldD/PmbA family protein [Rhodospirillaceae bacterium]
MIDPDSLAGIAEDALSRARAAGADAADVLVIAHTHLAASQRLGKPERSERAESFDLGLRVFDGKRMAMVASSDHAPDALDELAARAVAMARVVPEDPFCGLADPDQLARDWLDLDLADPLEPTPDVLVARAAAAEEAGLAVPGVTNSEGAEASYNSTAVATAATNGFRGSYAVTSSSFYMSAIAGEGTAMETDYEFSSAAHAEDLGDPATIGRIAGERAVRRLGARKVESARVPVVLDPRVAGGLLRSLLGAISGAAVARGTSFLKDAMGTQILPEGLSVTDQPHLRRGRRSRPFDGEGLPSRAWNLVDRGRLTTWLLDLRSARQLGLAPTGHGSRGAGSPPSPSATNVALEGGSGTREELLKSVGRGFYVTGLMGMGVNLVTGDYSRGAHGFWIEDGELADPVSEVTVAGNLKDMLRSLTAAGDLERRYGVDSPTLRIDGMTLAGQ